MEIFSKICQAVNNEMPAVREAFRVPVKEHNGSQQRDKTSSPIVVKLFSSYARSQLFKSVAGFCKAKKRALKLNDIAIDGSASIHIHESLSKANREIMHYAAQLRRQKHLSAVFSIRGQVLVRKRDGEMAVRVLDKKGIDEIVGTT